MSNLRAWSLSLLFAFLAISSGTPLKRDVTTVSVDGAYVQLQSWYNFTIGIWAPSTGWWNSANCLTTIANLAAIDTGVKILSIPVFANTFTKAPQYNSGVSAGKAIGPNWLTNTWYTATPMLAKRNTGFLNGYYDDEGWWALAWIAAYDVTRNPQYLFEARTIFADMNTTFGQTNCSMNTGGVGGIWWDKKHTYVNAIANELHLAVAANLAIRTSGSEAATYLATAKQQWAWFRGSGMINPSDNINDGLDQQSCQNNGGTVWSYNQGVVLGGLVALSKATGDGSYLATAQSIADAGIAKLAPNGILHDPCEPNCGADGTQFKGVFARNLQYLSQASPTKSYNSFLRENANSILASDAQRFSFSVDWAGPFVSPANASTQSSAMDALVGALATS